jgi:uncharacterized metal-binding protein
LDIGMPIFVNNFCREIVIVFGTAHRFRSLLHLWIINTYTRLNRLGTTHMIFNTSRGGSVVPLSLVQVLIEEVGDSDSFRSMLKHVAQGSHSSLIVATG